MCDNDPGSINSGGKTLNELRVDAGLPPYQHEPLALEGPLGQRFSYVKYDQPSVDLQEHFKQLFMEIEGIMSLLPDGRAKSLVFTKLEEAYMWIGKAIRDKQLQARGGIEQPERKNG